MRHQLLNQFQKNGERDTGSELQSRLKDRVANFKTALLKEWRPVFHQQERMLRLTLAEAEAVAWQTGLPQLVFPLLAAEKMKQSARWNVRQRFLMAETTPANARAGL